jgi:hypothetical protein
MRKVVDFQLPNLAPAAAVPGVHRAVPNFQFGAGQDPAGLANRVEHHDKFSGPTALVPFLVEALPTVRQLGFA